MSFGSKVIHFYNTIEAGFALPEHAAILNPYKEERVQQVMAAFYQKYYSDEGKRIFILGINPGRFGAGVTGIPFTDPIRLEAQCGIRNELKKLPELSSVFIYEMINAYGDINKFYKKFYITAVSPVGFIYKGKNMNYYDDKKFYLSIKNFIVQELRKQIKFGADRTLSYCLGEGKNFEIFTKLNDEYNFFQKIIPLPHPRWIMQYRRKEMLNYIEKYVKCFQFNT